MKLRLGEKVSVIAGKPRSLGALNRLREMLVIG
jgi:hypothetical protein